MKKITLKNGTILDNLTLNGNNYISNDIISDDVFTNNLDEITISDGENTIIKQNMKLVQNKVYDNQSWFILAEKTESDLLKERLQATESALIDLMMGV